MKVYNALSLKFVTSNNKNQEYNYYCKWKSRFYRNYRGSFEVVFENGFLWKRVFFILLLELCCENQTT